MSHTPPVPEGNTSPYPLKEPPHADHQPTAKPRRSDSSDDGDGAGQNLMFPLGAALAFGAAALAAALYLASDRQDSQRKRKRKNRA